MSIRENLGDYSSIVCFKAVVTGVEETLGQQAAAVALRGAGRRRGKQLATSLGLLGKGTPPAETQRLLDAALGADGTRLCRVDAVEEAGDGYVVRLSETVCSAGEPAGSPRELTFTMGAIHGAIEAISGRKLRARQTGSVLRGDAHDVVSLEPL